MSKAITVLVAAATVAACAGTRQSSAESKRLTEASDRDWGRGTHDQKVEDEPWNRGDPAQAAMIVAPVAIGVAAATSSSDRSRCVASLGARTSISGATCHRVTCEGSATRPNGLRETCLGSKGWQSSATDRSDAWARTAQDAAEKICGCS